MLLSGASSIDIIQSILVHVYWQKPNDTTAYVKLGIAKRMADQMGMSFPQEMTEAIQLSEEARRKHIDRERTYLSEFLGLCGTTQLTFFLPHPRHTWYGRG
jgi:hypothetical protein